MRLADEQPSKFPMTSATDTYKLLAAFVDMRVAAQALLADKAQHERGRARPG